MWNNIRHTLVEYYETRNDSNSALMTETACIAWNDVVRRRSEGRSEEECILAKIRFRGMTRELIEDYSHIWRRDFEHDENRILLRFENGAAACSTGGVFARHIIVSCCHESVT
jgi:hypothetical protein